MTAALCGPQPHRYERVCATRHPLLKAAGKIQLNPKRIQTLIKPRCALPSKLLKNEREDLAIFAAIDRSGCCGLDEEVRVVKVSLLTSRRSWLLIPRKEVIQPHLPIRLPCYDFTPVTKRTVVGGLLAVSLPTSGAPRSHGVTGGVYKTRERIHRGMLIRDY